MKNILLILSGVILLQITACRRTCENVKVGETNFADNTMSFFKYAEGDVVSFEGENGKTLDFTVSTTESVYFICQKVTCDPVDPYKSSYCEYIEAPQHSIFLNTDSTLIGIEASIYAYEPETELLYDAVRFTLSHVNTTATASHITDVKFMEPEFDRQQLVDIDEFMAQTSEVKLRDQTYRDVLVCDDESLSLYFTKNQGFVGFEIEGELFTLKN